MSGPSPSDADWKRLQGIMDHLDLSKLDKKKRARLNSLFKNAAYTLAHGKQLDRDHLEAKDRMSEIELEQLIDSL